MRKYFYCFPVGQNGDRFDTNEEEEEDIFVSESKIFWRQMGNLEGKGGETSTNTLDNSQGESSFVLSVNVGVLHTQNVLEVISICNYEACLNKS